MKKSWRFGILDIQGIVISIALVYLLLKVIFPDIGIRRAEWRFSAAVFAVAIGLCGTYLSTRLASECGIQGAAKRLLLQLVCVIMLFPPLICITPLLLPVVALMVSSARRKQLKS